VTPIKSRRSYVKTGRMGPPPGSRNHLTHGLKTAAMIESRRAYEALMKAAREAIRDAK